MTEPTPDQLAEWRRLADEATEGPWEAYSLPAVPPGQWQMVGVGQVDNEMGHRIEVMFDDDAAFIAGARTAVPVLLDEVERLRGALEDMTREARLSRESTEKAVRRAEAADAERDMGRMALDAIARERNTWARQLADMQDERDTARDEAEKARTEAAYQSNERTAADLRTEDAEAERDRLREGVRALIDSPDDTQWWEVVPYMDPPEQDEVVEVAVVATDRLRALLEDR